MVDFERCLAVLGAYPKLRLLSSVPLIEAMCLVQNMDGDNFRENFWRIATVSSDPSHDAMKQFFGKRSRSALTAVLLISLALHVVAVLIFGTIKFVSEVLREETVFEAAPVAPPPQNEPEYTVNLQQRNQSTPPPRPPAIVVNNPSELDIPALDIDVNVDSSAVYGRGGGGFGSGLAGVREMAVSANLFGATVTAKNLGVVLDVSRSAHPHLDKAIAEIDRSFADAPIILVSGCALGISTAGDELSDGERFQLYDRLPAKALDQPNRKVSQQLATFFAKLGSEKSEELKRYFKQRGNIHLIYEGNPFDADTALERLIRMRVDTIYWFADFEDPIRAPAAEELRKKLLDDGITLIAHNFSGKPVVPEVKQIAKATGGTTIEKIP